MVAESLITYFVSSRPPLFEGADQVKVALPGAATAEIAVGSRGIDFGTYGTAAADVVCSLLALAVTTN